MIHLVERDSASIGRKTLGGRHPELPQVIASPAVGAHRFAVDTPGADPGTQVSVLFGR